MNTQDLLKKGEIRKRSVNIAQARSIIQAALSAGTFAKETKLDDTSSTPLFKELYDAFRQLGDAKWWMLGYEAYSHKASIELLKTAPVNHTQQLQQLSRIQKIREDAVYRGLRVSMDETRELLKLWEQTHKELIEWIQAE